ncbi:MAG: sugar phosphate isomerase/epimerase family protein [Planctomycetota bacterium]
MHAFDRRTFLAASGSFLTGLVLPRSPRRLDDEPLFRISLAEWSLHRALASKEMSNLDFPKVARECGIDGVEYVNTFFRDHVSDADYLRDLRQRCDDAGVKSLLIMCDGLGELGNPDEVGRGRAVAKHEPWLDAARALGCHAIRVNAASSGSFDEQQKLAADGLRRLTELGAERELDVIVENHGGLSSNGKWLAGVIRKVDHPRCGTLPDFGNFRIRGNETYDRYTGVAEMMPFARAVSAKSYGFDDDGNETTIDYARMLAIVVGAGYRGFVGVEYEGDGLGEREGILATKKLLERVRAELVRAQATKRDAEGAASEGKTDKRQ